jgi:hypothetical protein
MRNYILLMFAMVSLQISSMGQVNLEEASGLTAVKAVFHKYKEDPTDAKFREVVRLLDDRKTGANTAAMIRTHINLVPLKQIDDILVPSLKAVLKSPRSQYVLREALLLMDVLPPESLKALVDDLRILLKNGSPDVLTQSVQILGRSGAASEGVLGELMELFKKNMPGLSGFPDDALNILIIEACLSISPGHEVTKDVIARSLSSTNIYESATGAIGHLCIGKEFADVERIFETALKSDPLVVAFTVLKISRNKLVNFKLNALLISNLDRYPKEIRDLVEKLVTAKN